MKRKRCLTSFSEKIETLKSDLSDFVLLSWSRKLTENRANNVEQHKHFALRSCFQIFNLILHHLSLAKDAHAYFINQKPMTENIAPQVAKVWKK